MQLSEAQIFRRDTKLPDPIYPVPLNIQMFPSLPYLIRGKTQEQHHKLAQLEHYNIAPVFYTCHHELATIPDNIHLDNPFGLLMFQGFGGEFNRRQEALAASTGEMIPLFWEGTKLGISLNITQFQTDKFERKRGVGTDEKSMFPFLGFFDWRAVFIEYYKQSFAYLRETGQIHPPYLSVNIIRRTQEMILSELARRASGRDEKRMEEEREKIKEKEKQWLTSLGLIFEGNRGFPWSEVMFMDTRDIPLDPHFASMMQKKRKT